MIDSEEPSLLNSRRIDIVRLLIDRDGDKCQIGFCSDPYYFTESGSWMRTIDHYIPLSRSGEDRLVNYQLAHFKCNNIKSNRIYLEDGTLEPLNGRAPKVKVNKRPPCSTCKEGRGLGPDDECHICGLGPMPEGFPRWRQRDPRVCDHDEWFCWICVLNFVPRKSVLESQYSEYK